jgi:hypothetical protein
MRAFWKNNAQEVIVGLVHSPLANGTAKKEIAWIFQIGLHWRIGGIIHGSLRVSA